MVLEPYPALHAVTFWVLYRGKILEPFGPQLHLILALCLLPHSFYLPFPLCSKLLSENYTGYEREKQ